VKTWSHFYLINEEEAGSFYFIYAVSQGECTAAFGDKGDLIIITSAGGNILFTGICSA
jgi:hypothetical protein